MLGGDEATAKVLAAGTRVEQYTIEEVLGVGGSTVVYRALDRKLGRRVALKILPLEESAAEQEPRLVAEARAAASLNHPNIAVVYGMGQENGLCYIAEELVEGTTLRQRLQDPSTTGREMLELLRQVVRAMAEAHAKGIGHFDLKPDNIMVTPGGVAKVLDFGLARWISRHAGGGTTKPLGKRVVEGTPGYMSPEQAAGVAKLDARSDVFSFGCILHEVRGVPHLEPLVKRCLERDREKRTITMAELEGELAALAVRARRSEWRTWAVMGAVLLGFAVLGIRAVWAPAARQPAVAVIPFASRAAGAAAHASGLSDGVTFALAQMPGLRVIARTSSKVFEGGKLDARKASQALKVDALVTGEVAESGGRVQVSVDLIGKEATQWWGAKYDRPVADLPAVEALIAEEIARRMLPGVGQAEKKRLERLARVAPEAYALYQRGKYQLSLYTPESRQNAVALLEQALAADPSFALGHAELARCYRFLSGSAVTSSGAMLPKAEAAAQRALAADPGLAEGHAALADIYKDGWRWKEAELEYRESLRLNPNLVGAYVGYAIYLGVMSKHDEALQTIGKARRLDPLGTPTGVHAAAVEYNARRFREAVKTLEQVLARDPAAPSAWGWMGMSRTALGQYTEAIEAYGNAVRGGDDSLATQCFLVYALARGGRKPEAERLRAGILRSKQFVPLSSLAILHLGFGERAAALEELRSALAARDTMLQYADVEAHFDDLRDDPEFRRIVNAMFAANGARSR